jgi:predicted DNA binding CopG/RHH family protein
MAGSIRSTAQRPATPPAKTTRSGLIVVHYRTVSHALADERRVVAAYPRQHHDERAVTAELRVQSALERVRVDRRTAAHHVDVPRAERAQALEQTSLRERDRVEHLERVSGDRLRVSHHKDIKLLRNRLPDDSTYCDLHYDPPMPRRAKPRPMEMKVVAERVDEDAEVSELVSRLEDEADREVAAGTVTLRWGKEQIEVVKHAAAIPGVPYQTYLKQVVFRQALADIEQARDVLGGKPRS